MKNLPVYLYANLIESGLTPSDIKELSAEELFAHWFNWINPNRLTPTVILEAIKAISAFKEESPAVSDERTEQIVLFTIQTVMDAIQEAINQNGGTMPQNFTITTAPTKVSIAFNKILQDAELWRKYAGVTCVKGDS